MENFKYINNILLKKSFSKKLFYFFIAISIFCKINFTNKISFPFKIFITFFILFLSKNLFVRKKIKKASFYYQNKIKEQILEKQTQKSSQKNKDLEDLNEKIYLLLEEKSKLTEENIQIKEELKHFSEKQEKYQKQLLQTIHQQRQIIENKQLFISVLEKKIKTLMKEVKKILLVEENFSFETFPEKNTAISSYSYKENTKNKINSIIQDFLNCSQKCSFNFSSKNSIDLPISKYSIIYRCFFDKLKKDDDYIIFFFSQKQKKIFFVNNLFIQWIGWKSNFLLDPITNKIIKKRKEWFNNLYLSDKTDGFVEIKTKNKGDILFYYTIKKVPLNYLSSYSIGILLPMNNKNC